MNNIKNYSSVELKRWTILDSLTGKLHDITDDEFNQGLICKFIKLRGQYVEVENGHKIWIDGIVKK